jgi:hypothetical protein
MNTGAGGDKEGEGTDILGERVATEEKDLAAAVVVATRPWASSGRGLGGDETSGGEGAGAAIIAHHGYCHSIVGRFLSAINVEVMRLRNFGFLFVCLHHTHT